MNYSNTKQIRTDFLRASYCALFGKCPDEKTIDQFLSEMDEDGRQKS